MLERFFECREVIFYNEWYNTRVNCPIERAVYTTILTSKVKVYYEPLNVYSFGGLVFGKSSRII